MRRRSSPYSQIEEIQRSRSEVWMLVSVTVVLGLLLGIFTDGLSGWLRETLPAPVWTGMLIFCGTLTLALTLTVAWLFYGHTESGRARIEMWLPYHFPDRNRLTVAGATSYQPPRHARRALARRYAKNSTALRDLLNAWRAAQAQGRQFKDFIAKDHLLLSQCLALYVLHRYGEESLGAKAPYSFSQIDLKARRLMLDALPAPLRDNPFVRADQNAAEWRLLLPENVRFEAGELEWTLRHPRYGHVTVRWYPAISTAAPHSQPYEAVTAWMQPRDKAELYVVGCRVEANAHLRRVLLAAGEPFQTWVAGFMGRLEEALDLGYYLAQRPARIMRDLEWKIGWVPQGTSLVELLQSIDARLEALEMAAALDALDAADATPTEEEAGADFVV